MRKKLEEFTPAQKRAREFQYDDDLLFIKGVIVRRNVRRWDRLAEISSAMLLKAIDQEITRRESMKVEKYQVQRINYLP